MIKKSKIIVLVIVFIVFSYFILMRIEEDTWICDDGEWIKHGVPSSSKPEGKCTWLENLIPFR